jgi:hypothetical protein
MDAMDAMDAKDCLGSCPLAPSRTCGSAFAVLCVLCGSVFTQGRTSAMMRFGATDDELATVVVEGAGDGMAHGSCRIQSAIIASQ